MLASLILPDNTDGAVFRAGNGGARIDLISVINADVVNAGSFTLSHGYGFDSSIYLSPKPHKLLPGGGARYDDQFKLRPKEFIFIVPDSPNKIHCDVDGEEL